ncbi:MAG: hypothetical protein R3C59_30365 [Planctomycetaceae bacterium]
MDTEPGRSLILWTVRISVALYVVALFRFLQNRQSDRRSDGIYRNTWSAAWLMCVIHVICAFHFQHHWDHSAALQHTAEMTERVVGLHWAGGLYINYLFLTWWGIDVIRLWTKPADKPSVALHAVAVFMMINATVVFGPAWWWIPLGIVAVGLLWTTIPARIADR